LNVRSKNFEVDNWALKMRLLKKRKKVKVRALWRLRLGLLELSFN